MTSLKTISLAVVGDRAPLVRTARWRTVAKTDLIGFLAMFLPTSYGFRPGRGCKDALREAIG